MRRPIPSTALLRLATAVLSGVALASAFPPSRDTQAAWLGLVPLMVLARFTPPRAAFGWGYLSGLAFWLCSLAWLLQLGFTGPPWPLAALGWIGLAAYCALYTGAFTAVAAALFRAWTPPAGEAGAGRWRGLGGNVAMLVCLPLLWVGFEYLRSTVCTGFPWNALGVTQYRNIPLIQLAAWGGVYAVSALLVLVNAGLAFMLIRLREVYWLRRPNRLQVELMITLVGMLLALAHGVHVVRALDAVPAGGPRLNIAAVQPNIEQVKKWPPEFVREVYGKLDACTEALAPFREKLDLVVWPETAVPGFLPDDPECLAFVRGTVGDLGAPLLVGAMEGEEIDRDLRLYNSSFLIDRNTEQLGLYRKMHLVPFGEYIPLARRIPLIRRFEPLGFSCYPGETMTVFHLPVRGAGDGAPVARFSVLICFEDTMAGLARRAVAGGARLLVNQTNDAWFDGTGAAVQHMAHTVFRCVENRVPAVRACNTGVTCFIDSAGRIDETTRDLLLGGAWTSVHYRKAAVDLPPAGMRLTFYTRFGDWPFAIPCGAGAAFSLAAVAWMERRRRAGAGSDDAR